MLNPINLIGVGSELNQVLASLGSVEGRLISRSSSLNYLIFDIAAVNTGILKFDLEMRHTH